MIHGAQNNRILSNLPSFQLELVIKTISIHLKNCDDCVWVRDVNWDMVCEVRVGRVGDKNVCCNGPSQIVHLWHIWGPDTWHWTWSDTVSLCHILTQTMDRILHWTRTTIKYLCPHCLQQPKKFAQIQSLFLAVCIKSFIVFLSDSENKIFWLQKTVKQAK